MSALLSTEQAWADLNTEGFNFVKGNPELRQVLNVARVRFKKVGPHKFNLEHIRERLRQCGYVETELGFWKLNR